VGVFLWGGGIRFEKYFRKRRIIKIDFIEKV